MRNHISSLLRKIGAPGKQMRLRRNIQISCRGKLISVDKLFDYTNGNFLVNENFQFEQRYVKFDLDALCDVAAAAGGEASPIKAIEKMEGGFSKALLMKKENGMEIIAKIPCRNSGPAVYTTESEVAVLKYVIQHTNVPVPEVYAWSSDPTNPVGVEYIIMGRAPGVPVFKIWGEMSQPRKLELIKQLTKFEHELASIQLPAYGSLYLRAFSRDIPGYKLLGSDADPSASYCVGRSGDRSFITHGCQEWDGSKLDPGPWTTLSAYGIAIAKREMFRISGGSSPHPETFYQGSFLEQTNLLESAIRLLRLLDSHPILAQSATPVIWHTDLHMGNIYVSPDEPSQILSLIDWQSVSILPLFLQARWPIFLEPPQNYARGFQKPELPDDFDRLDREEQQLARYEQQQAVAAKAYEVSNYLENRSAYTAMNLPRVFRELFKRCGEISEVGVIPLRACLIEIFTNWFELGFTGDCPYSFSQEEIDDHNSQFREYEDWHKVHELARKCLDTDEDGWIPPDMDITEKRQQNQELLNMFINQMAAEKSPEEARRMWPFVENCHFTKKSH
ncbi:phosphotransferase enzyme family protein [Histoplasma capsulatum G186AR]|uniref:Altered inheritance of mitochondria protein 9, mitochondrial n=1 Tax=Ajellomyces capsulatus TaxID=5037 RepID=A0A8H8CS43_AJECA|nr:phosphotransferase enzyme family protein [Histoplasma capsulatum]QSS70392.1 phosphotransferase enzyme family protein [Histoplasma capsulatum G186AR]